jgi:CheY-like chemotaxis protein
MVFMDIQMPVMNGYDAARAIRACGRDDLKTLPIIAMTADAFADDVKRAKEAGMDSHISKPIDIEKLEKIIDEFS